MAMALRPAGGSAEHGDRRKRIAPWNRHGSSCETRRRAIPLGASGFSATLSNSGRPDMASFEAYRAGYEKNWAALKIRPNRQGEADKEARRLLTGKARYQEVERRTGVPWWFVGLCHYRESHFKDRKSTRLNSSHLGISYAVFCLKK